MSVIGSNILAGAAGQGGYTIEESLRFNSSQSSYLSRTPASASNRKTFTFSAWVKLGAISSWFPFLIGYNGGSQYTTLGYRSDTQVIRMVQDNGGGGVYNLESVAKFRDYSAWYHVIFAFDTTQATAADRVKLYINGVQQTLTGSYPSQNSDTWVNIANNQYIGAWLAVSEKFDGYINFESEQGKGSTFCFTF